jgi:hypothetical protein
MTGQSSVCPIELSCTMELILERSIRKRAFIVGVNLTVSQRIKVRPGIRSLPTLDLEDGPTENVSGPFGP